MVRNKQLNREQLDELPKRVRVSTKGSCCYWTCLSVWIICWWKSPTCHCN